MTCSEVVELLLEADPFTVAGLKDSPVASHLQSCDDCQRIATRLVAAHQHDSAEYLGVASRRTPTEIVALVLATPKTARTLPSRRLRSIVRIAAALIPLAAAASFVVIANARRDARRDALQASFDAAFAAARPVTNVKVPPGRNAVVFSTRDPQISVVWIY